jgi:hypothetical protein
MIDHFIFQYPRSGIFLNDYLLVRSAGGVPLFCAGFTCHGHLE